MRWIGCGVAALSLMAGRGRAAEVVFPPPETFVPSAPIVALAAQVGVPLAGLAPGAVDRRAQPAPGDRCVVLVSLRDGDEVEQWLIDFAVAALTAAEEAKLAEASGGGGSFTLYTSTGTKLTYGQQPVAMDVVVRGPLDAAEKRIERAVAQVEEKRARLVVNGEYLALGLDRAAATILRLRNKEDGKVGFGVSTNPPDETEAATNRTRLEAMGLTADDERAMAGAVPALMEFFRVASQTPGLQEILRQVIDVPWWALVKGLGSVNAGINLQGGKIAAVAGEPGRYGVPLVLAINGANALVAELVVERPLAPGSTLAGITAIYAGAPNGKGKRVTIELLASECAPPSAPAAEGR